MSNLKPSRSTRLPAAPKTPTQQKFAPPSLEMLKQTPIVTSKSAGGSGMGLLPDPTRPVQHDIHARDFEGRCWGPIAVDAWMDAFVPPAPAKVVLQRVSWPSNEKLNEKLFAGAVSDSLQRKLRASEAFVKDTHHTRAISNGKKIQPDFSILMEDFDLSPDDDDDDADSEDGRDDAKDRRQDYHRRLLRSVLLFGELKSDSGDDPFAPFDKAPNDNERTKDTVGSRQTRGQIIKYAQGIIVNSHRAFLLGFVTFGNDARLVRFDNSGIVYSAPFKWRSATHLGDLFQRMAFASDEARGLDTSVQALSTTHTLVTEARRIFHDSIAAQLLPPSETWDTVFESPRSSKATYSLANVFDESSGVFHRLLFDQPQVCPERLQGRFTRCYIAVDLDEKAVVYMKRSWRIDADGIEREYDVYCDLVDAKVPHLPGCFFGGDTPRQSAFLASLQPPGTKPKGKELDLEPLQTHSATFARDKKLTCRLTDKSFHEKGTVIDQHRHVLHVLLFKKIGTPLNKFRRSLHLCMAVYDAIESHGVALKHGYLHRDVSIGNILIHHTPTGDREVEGLLIDWDLCTSTKVNHARRYGRTGTWEFISARIISNPSNQPQAARDDLESFVHVLHYTALHYVEAWPVTEVEQRRGLLGATQAVFTRHVLGHENAADNKIHYLRNDNTAIIRACNRFQVPLHYALDDLRILVASLYDRAPAQEKPADWRTQPHVENADPAAPSQSEAVVNKCNHAAMRKILHRYICTPEDWRFDPAVDQFPADLLKESTIAAYTSEVPSNTSTASKRTATDAELEDEQPTRAPPARSAADSEPGPRRRQPMRQTKR